MPQRYARAVDVKDYDAVGALFDPAGSVEGMRGAAAVPAYLDGMRNSPAVFAASMHFMGDPLIDLAPGASEADVDTYAVVYQLRAPDDPKGDVTLGMRYVDRVVKIDGRWLIHHRKTHTLWMRGSL